MLQFKNIGTENLLQKNHVDGLLSDFLKNPLYWKKFEYNSVTAQQLKRE